MQCNPGNVVYEGGTVKLSGENTRIEGNSTDDGDKFFFLNYSTKYKK